MSLWACKADKVKELWLPLETLFAETMAMFGVDKLDDRVDLEEDPAEFLEPPQLPGPRSDNKTEK